MNRTALQSKQVGVWRMAFRARNSFGTFEKRAPGVHFAFNISLGLSFAGWNFKIMQQKEIF